MATTLQLTTFILLFALLCPKLTSNAAPVSEFSTDYSVFFLIDLPCAWKTKLSRTSVPRYNVLRSSSRSSSADPDLSFFVVVVLVDVVRLQSRYWPYYFDGNLTAEEDRSSHFRGSKAPNLVTEAIDRVQAIAPLSQSSISDRTHGQGAACVTLIQESSYCFAQEGVAMIPMAEPKYSSILPNIYGFRSDIEVSYHPGPTDSSFRTKLEINLSFHPPCLHIDGFRSGKATGKDDSAFQIWRSYQSILKYRSGELQNRFTSFASVQSSISLWDKQSNRTFVDPFFHGIQRVLFFHGIQSIQSLALWIKFPETTKLRSLQEVQESISPTALLSDCARSYPKLPGNEEMEMVYLSLGFVYLHLLWTIGGLLTTLACFGNIFWLLSTHAYDDKTRVSLLMAAVFVGTVIALGCFSAAASLVICSMQCLTGILKKKLPTVLPTVKSAHTLLDKLSHCLRNRWFSGTDSANFPFQIWRVAQLECA